MAAIPEYQQQTRARGNVVAGPVSSGKGVIAIGQALQNVTDNIVQMREQDAAVWATKALSDAQVEWSQQLSNRQQQAQPGAENFTGDILKDYDTYSAKVAESAPTGISRQYINERLSAYRATLAQTALNYEATERTANTVDVVQQSINSGRMLAYQSPDQFPSLLAERLATIDMMRLDPDTKRKLKEDAQYQMAHDAVAGMVDANSTAAISALRSPVGKSGNLAIEALSAESRAGLMESAERKRIADENHAYTMAQREEVEVQDRASKQGDQLLANNQLSARWIESNKDTLSAEDYRYFYQKLTDPSERESDPMIYASLRERASLGQDIRIDAREALTDGSIKTSDYDRLVGEVESSRPNWYKLGSEYISTSAAVSDINPDPAAAQRKAEMLDDWNQWAEANPTASKSEAREMSHQIVQEYALIDWSQMLLTKRKPTYLVGSRNAATIENLDETELRTVEAFESGEIGEQEFTRQALLLNEWRDLLEKRGDAGSQ